MLLLVYLYKVVLLLNNKILTYYYINYIIKSKYSIFVLKIKIFYIYNIK